MRAFLSRHSWLIVVLLGLSAAGVLAAAAPRAVRPTALIPPAVASEGARISGERLHSDVAFLADDALQGRGTGTRGFDTAANYVANRMSVIGLEPAGTDGFLSPVPFRRADLDEQASSLALVRDGHVTPLVMQQDYVLGSDFLRTKWTTEAPLVFVGFGVTAPELGYDDFANVDVRGKVLVTFRGAPASFPNDQRAYYSNGTVKEQNAAAHGAIGVLTVRRPEEELRNGWDRVVRQNKLPGFRWTDDGGAPANTQATIELSGTLNRSGAEAAFAGASRSLAQAFTDADSSRAQGFPLACSVKAVRVTRHANVPSPNVVGLLRGSDPALAQEALVLTAHLDHLGISTPVNGDSINNGAYDNATGTAMMLEVARAFGRLPQPPKRSILFLAVTGEEKGLQGSDYFARHPAPLDLDVVGNLNLDEVMMLMPMTHIIAFGGEHTSMGPVLEKAAALCSLTVMPDPVPEEVVFVRSDQFSFVKQGIPGIFPVSGMDGSARGEAANREWNKTRYHSPSDDMTQVFDWPSGARFTRMAFFTAWMLADAAKAPSWNDGDFFGAKFGAKK